MEHGIELNGVANLTILLDNIVEECDFVNQTQSADIKSAKEQLILLERYMLAYCSAINKGEQPPFWHDIKLNPKLYPTNRERTG